MSDIIGSGVPYMYDYINCANAMIKPSTIHVENTGLNRYFERYLLQKAISVFEWKLPERWSKNYFLYVLYCWGFLAIFDSKQFGVIPQGCSLRGYNIFYQPTNAIITNPLIKDIKEPEIGKECVIMRLQPDYGGIMDIVSYYANLMALASESLGVNLVNSKLSYVFGAENKAQAESFKKMFDQITSGNPAAFVDKTLFDENGQPRWFTFLNNLQANYVADRILSDMRTIENMFDTEIGIPNANTDKRERLITDEVNANNFETKSKCALWLESLKEGCKEANEMFGLDLDVNWRQELREEMESDGNGIDTGAL